MAEYRSQLDDANYASDKIVKFPLDLDASKGGSWMLFRGGSKGNLTGAIILPTPSGLSFSSSAMYQDISLGVIEAGFDDYEKFRGQGDGVIESLAKTGHKAFEGMKSAAGGSTNLQFALGQQMLTGMGFSNGLLNAAGVIARRDLRKQKLAINPNTELYFQNMGLRTFNFSFRMIAKSEKESIAIANIVQKFEDMAHPEYANGDDKYVFKYPDEFDITFYEGTMPNDFIPTINTCVITGFTHTYNSETNAFYEGGAPITVDISIAFKEIAVNTKKTVNRSQASKDVEGYKLPPKANKQVTSKNGRFTVRDIPDLVEDKFDQLSDGVSEVYGKVKGGIDDIF